MRISQSFLRSIVVGMGFTTGSIISLHLYSLICGNEEVVEDNEEVVKDNNKTKTEIKNTEEKKEDEIEDYDTLFWCRMFRRFTHYSRI